jgi:hypothetical protein
MCAADSLQGIGTRLVFAAGHHSFPMTILRIVSQEVKNVCCRPPDRHGSLLGRTPLGAPVPGGAVDGAQVHWLQGRVLLGVISELLKNAGGYHTELGSGCDRARLHRPNSPHPGAVTLVRGAAPRRRTCCIAKSFASASASPALGDSSPAMPAAMCPGTQKSDRRAVKIL